MPNPNTTRSSKTWTAGTLTYTSTGLICLFSWLLLGDFAWSMRERSIGPMVQWYLNHLNVPNIVFGLLLSTFPALLTFAIVPIISVKSDAHRGRLGRRIPFLLVMTPLAAFGMIGLALTPMLASWVHSLFPGQSELVVSIICFTVFWGAFEVVSIGSVPIFGGLINDVVPKELIGRFYGLFRAVGLIDGMIFNYWIIGKVPANYMLIMILVGVFYGTAFTWVCFKIKEGKYPQPSAGEHAPMRGFRKGAGAYFRQCFSKPYYRDVFCLITVATLSFTPLNIFSIPFARSLDVSMDTYGKALSLTFLISLCLSYVIGWLADRFHPLRMTIASLFAYTAILVWAWLYAKTPETFLVAWVAHGVISGCFYTSSASLGQRLYPRDKFAQYASAAAMVMAPCNMVTAPLVGLMIDSTNNTYRYTFIIGLALVSIALVMAFRVHQKFMQLGGLRSYTAPE